jgi:hypothetical protein
MHIFNEDKLIQIFCMVDDFCKEYSKIIQQRLLTGHRHRKNLPEPSLSISEIMTIEILYHLSADFPFLSGQFFHRSLSFASSFD